MSEFIGPNPNRGQFEAFTEQHSLGREVAEMHAYRLRESTLSVDELFAESVAPIGSLTVDDILPVIKNIQSLTDDKLILTGGWATLLHTKRSLRPTSSEIDLLAHPRSLSGELSEAILLRYVPDWRARVGFYNLPDGQRIRVEINTLDLLPESSPVEHEEGIINVATPTTIALGKMARSYFGGVKERDQIDIAALTLSGDSDKLNEKLRQEIATNPLVGKAWNKLDLPNSVASIFQANETEHIRKFSSSLF